MPAKKSTKNIETPEVAVTAAPETVNKTARKRTAAAKSPAATHKNAAPRVAVRTRTAKPAAAKPAAARPTFDASLHHEEIAREAYLLWEARGHAHGSEGEDWFRATAIVRARYESAV